MFNLPIMSRNIESYCDWLITSTFIWFLGFRKMIPRPDAHLPTPGGIILGTLFRLSEFIRLSENDFSGFWKMKIVFRPPEESSSVSKRNDLSKVKGVIVVFQRFLLISGDDSAVKRISPACRKMQIIFRQPQWAFPGHGRNRLRVAEDSELSCSPTWNCPGNNQSPWWRFRQESCCVVEGGRRACTGDKKI